MNKKQIIFTVSLTLITGATIYFGFVRKYNGVTWYQKISGGDPLANLDRAGAIVIIEQAGGKKMEGNYGDDYLIARAKAITNREPFFFLNNGANKYNTITGKAVSL